MRKWLLAKVQAWLTDKPREAPISDELAALRKFVDKHELRIEEIGKHFVIEFDPATGAPKQTLADKYAEEDGKPKPKALLSRQWNQRRRMLEARDARNAVRKPQN